MPEAKESEKKAQSFIERLFEKLMVAPGSLENATLSEATRQIQEAISNRQKKSAQ